MTPPPPRSTLFPYTTLFRSVPRSRQDIIELCRRELQEILHPAREARLLKATVIKETAATFSPGPDRKSTRLNSSHGSISYAVFCLKKKNSVSPQRNCKSAPR